MLSLLLTAALLPMPEGLRAPAPIEAKRPVTHTLVAPKGAAVPAERFEVPPLLARPNPFERDYGSAPGTWLERSPWSLSNEATEAFRLGRGRTSAPVAGPQPGPWAPGEPEVDGLWKHYGVGSGGSVRFQVTYGPGRPCN